MLLNREALLKKEELKIEKVTFDNGDFVFVREMYGREKNQFEQSLVREIRDEDGNVKDYERSLEDFRAKLEYCLGSYGYDGNPSGLHECAKESSELLKKYKEKNPRKVSKKMLEFIDKVVLKYEKTH